ncbi:MAG: hypothetical protein AAF960_25260 [Bacteroidota bacterium]
MQQLGGVFLIFVGIFFLRSAFISKKEGGIESYIFMRRISAGILAIIIGIIVFLEKW